MAPPRPSLDHTIDRTREYEEFIAKLRVFHEARGTHFDAEPRLGNANVDLLKLYNHILANGGYDKVSEEKLLWRKMCVDLGLMTNNAPSAAFTLKTIFYKYLAAYEIRTEYGKEPPPPEILENTTARGGNLLTRTLENYQINRGSAPEQSEASGDDATPARDRRGDENPGSGRASRGLREAPPQRVIFQPDTNSSRQTRHSSGQHSSNVTPTSHPQNHQQGHQHQHAHSHSHLQPVHTPQQHAPRGPSYSFNSTNPDNFSLSVQNYEPRPNVPIPLRPVETPINNPEAFAKRQRLLRQQAALAAAPGQIPFRQALPGGGPFDGPNIYVRCFQALRSSVLAEQAFGLNHLVKISFERGDKYRFEQFHGLAEGLTEKALEVGNLFWHVNWTICYDGEPDEASIGELDGVNGTPDILERIAQLTPKDIQDSIQPADFLDQLVLITEAVLTIRNMVMLPENAFYMAEFITLKDLLCIILHLPDSEMVVELKHFALDIAEQVTPFLVLDPDDPLYLSLLAQLTSPDRGAILTSLRAIGRISMNLAETNKLGNVPQVVLQNIMSWLLLNDDELMDACLDFLYQYTAVVSNVENLLKAIRAENLVSHLVRLLSHGAKRVHKDFILEHERKQGSSEEVIQIPADLLDRLLAVEEPERSFAWLRCFFEEDPDSSITQITIWQAYNAAFAAILQQTQRPMINAADFIRNISQVYQNAGAQIIREHGSDVQKFIIKGIRARARPINPEGREYFSCLWSIRHPKHASARKCRQWFIDSEKMYEHIITAHLGESRGDDKLFKNKEQEYQCWWGACRKYAVPTKMHLAEFMSHVKTHLGAAQHKQATANGVSDSALTPGGSVGGTSSNKRHKRPYVVPAKAISLTYEETLTLPRDERNPNSSPQAAGIPLSAVLVLRNLARNVVKTESEEELLKEHEIGGEGGGWNERLFRPLLPRLYEVMTENKAIAPYIASLFQFLSDD